LNYLRKEKGEKLTLDEVKNELGDYAFSPDKALLKQEFENQIEAIIAEMPVRRAQVFRLSRMEGFTYKEIADILSISIHTVQNHMVKALQHFAHLRVKK